MLKRYIGIDIGIRNFAYCVVDWYSSCRWKVKEINDINTGIRKTCNVVLLHKKMYVIMDKIFENIPIPRVDCVIVEAQPGKRLVMERVLCAVISYILLKNPETKVLIRRSQDKFSIDSSMGGRYPRGRKNYNARKALSIDLGFRCLNDSKNSFDHEAIVTWIERTFKKKDDIFDAFLLILKYKGYTL